MLFDLCKELNNWFETEIHLGEFTVEDNALKDVDFLAENQYFRVVGSLFNDNVFRYPAYMTDETFKGAIWAMAVPTAVITLSGEIDKWRERYEDVDAFSMSPLTSESFGGYSYTKAAGAGGGTSGGVNWKDVFRSRLNDWRKI